MNDNIQNHVSDDQSYIETTLNTSTASNADSDNFRKIISKNIKYFRKIRKIDQQELAMAAKVSPPTLRAVENGTSLPSFKTLHKISIALDLTIEDLMQPLEKKDITIESLVELL